jgi:HSP20 family protein
MAIVKWEPFKDLATLQDRMNQIFTDSFKSTLDDEGRLTQEWVPAVDVYEDQEAIQLHAELPGMEMKEIEVKVANNTLQVKGEKKLQNPEKKDHYHRVERVFGRFIRSFALPNTVDQEKIKAKYESGVLTVTLPKREETKPKSITVEVK